jgi:peptidoglycan/LPS O-acetylase OafA/YrhL
MQTSARSHFYRPELDSLRFFAFLGVFVVHVADYPVDFLVQHRVPRLAAEIAIACVQGGPYGVDVFFVLSAYLITELLLREKDLMGHLNVPAFYLRRLLRIWPVYYLVVLVAAFVPFFNPNGAFSARYVVPFLFFMGNWSFVVFGWPWTVALPLWSVSVEEQFYLLWPPVVARLSRRQIIIASVALVVVANVARIYAMAMHQSTDHIWGSTFAHLDSIAAGILIAVWLRGHAAPLGLAGRIGLIAFALVCFAVRGHFVLILPDEQLTLWGTLIGYPAVVLASASVLVAFIGLPLRSPTLQYLGKISYGLYAYHFVCLFLVDKFLPGTPGVAHAMTRAVAAFGLTVAVAALSYVALEKPFLNLKRRFTFVSSRPV